MVNDRKRSIRHRPRGKNFLSLFIRYRIYDRNRSQSVGIFYSKKEPTERLARWALFLQPFNLGIKYRPGKSNQNADCLSRAPVNVITSQSFEVGDWIEAQKNDTFCKAVLQEQLDSSRPDKKIKLRQISEEDNLKILPKYYRTD